MCGEEKPNESFKRQLTLAHTKSLLRNPNATTRYTATSKNCKACRLTLKRKTPLTTKEVRNKMNSGDIRRVKGELILKQRRIEIPQRRSKVMKEEWEKRKSKPFKDLKKSLQKQVAKYAARYHSSKRLAKLQGSETASLEQNRYNYDQARKVRDKVLEKAKVQMAQGKPLSIDIDADIGMMINPRFMTQYLLNEGEM